jgi:hypothetical protein
MPKPLSAFDVSPRADRQLPAQDVPEVPVVALSMGLGAFLVVTYLILVLFDLWLPLQAMNQIWAPLLPGFTWLTWPSFFLGLVEVFVYGSLVGLVFGPLYNFFAARIR